MLKQHVNGPHRERYDKKSAVAEEGPDGRSKRRRQRNEGLGWPLPPASYLSGEPHLLLAVDLGICRLEPYSQVLLSVLTRDVRRFKGKWLICNFGCCDVMMNGLRHFGRTCRILRAVMDVAVDGY